jgi:hypothetical protein
LNVGHVNQSTDARASKASGFISARRVLDEGKEVVTPISFEGRRAIRI